VHFCFVLFLLVGKHVHLHKQALKKRRTVLSSLSWQKKPVTSSESWRCVVPRRPPIRKAMGNGRGQAYRRRLQADFDWGTKQPAWIMHARWAQILPGQRTLEWKLSRSGCTNDRWGVPGFRSIPRCDARVRCRSVLPQRRGPTATDVLNTLGLIITTAHLSDSPACSTPRRDQARSEITGGNHDLVFGRTLRGFPVFVDNRTRLANLSWVFWPRGRTIVTGFSHLRRVPTFTV